MKLSAVKIRVHQSNNTVEFMNMVQSVQCPAHPEKPEFKCGYKANGPFHVLVFDTCCKTQNQFIEKAAKSFVGQTGSIQLQEGKPEKIYIPKKGDFVEYEGRTCKVMEVHRPFSQAKIWDNGQSVENRTITVMWNKLKFIAEGSGDEPAEFMDVNKL